MPDMTLPEAAASLGLAPSTLRTQVARGHVAAEKRGRDLWISSREVERYRRDRLGGAAAPIRAKTRARGKRAPKNA